MEKSGALPTDTKARDTMSSPSSSNTTAKNNHQLFCEVIGIEPYISTDTPKPNPKNQISLYYRVTNAYQHHTYQYWFVGTLSNAMMILQILLGATLAALGGSITTGMANVDTNKAAIAVTVLGALQTVIGGLSTYFKSRNQPNRARQFRNSLRKVKDNIEEAEMRFRNPAYNGDVMKIVDTMVMEYRQAVSDAEMNYPDFWMSGGSSPKKGGPGGVEGSVGVDGHYNLRRASSP